MTEKLQSLQRLKSAVEADDKSNRVALASDCFDTVDQAANALSALRGSLDAAYQLQKELLPNHSVVINTNGAAQLCDPIHGAQSTSFNSDPACAWLLCILKELEKMND